MTLAVMLAGCMTQRVDWNSRVGSYTYDQAVAEFGPPNTQDKLADGQVVAEWVRGSYNGGSPLVGVGNDGSPSGVDLQAPPSHYESSLQLTFSTNHVLSAWSKN